PPRVVEMHGERIDGEIPREQRDEVDHLRWGGGPYRVAQRDLVAPHLVEGDRDAADAVGRDLARVWTPPGGGHIPPNPTSHRARERDDISELRQGFVDRHVDVLTGERLGRG